MEWLLKIVEGPMNGAEIALVSGMRVSFGRDMDCDIVISDATLAEKAFELDVTAESVSLIAEGDEPRALPPFEIQTFGTTSFALGPAEGEWQTLHKPAPAEEAAPADASQAGEASAEGDEKAEAPQGEGDAGTDGEKPDGEEVPASDTEETSRPRHVWLWVLLLVVLLLAVAVALAWIFWPKVVEKHPQAERARAVCVEKARAWYGVSKTWVSSLLGRQEEAPKAVVDPKQALGDIAREHHLKLDLQPQPRLSGNLRRRTERLAIRALALAADPAVKFDLTDDETLRSASEALLFTVTEGAVKVVKAANRKVALSGSVSSRDELENVIRALAADVKGIKDVDATGVTVSGAAPVSKAVEAAPAAKGVKSPVPTAKKKAKPQQPVIPVAGILTVPYPCVVMQNGMRCTEGALVGGAKLVKIESDRLVFELDGRMVEWKP